MIYNKRDLKELLMKRDHLSEKEALNVINWTQQLFDEMISDECTLDELEDILADNLGLEPDYLHIFLF